MIETRKARVRPVIVVPECCSRLASLVVASGGNYCCEQSESKDAIVFVFAYVAA